MKNSFKQHIQEGYYNTEGPFFTIGAAMLDGEALNDCEVRVPLRTLNRHGLISGATGTGKTVSLQVFAEQLSLHGIPVLMMDLKGDLSGLAAKGTTNKHIVKRYSFLTEDWNADDFSIEFLSLSEGKGSQLRATVTEFGPILIARVLNLNDTQRGLLAVIFKYADDNGLALIDLKDLKKILQYAINDGSAEIQEEYGAISKTSVSTIMRKIVELEQQGADDFFGELSFDVNDLVRTDSSGKGITSIIRLTEIKDKPKLFSTFMLSLLAEIYATFPEEGDMEKPKLVMFIDEAHLLFDEASKELRDQIESIIKLIRSKGVGIFFCTQSPTDIPEEVLSQLGFKIQHALRAFTSKDRKNIQKIAQNFPDTEFYKTDEILTSMGIGEALVTCLNEKGIPTPLAATLMRSPKSRMGILNDKELDQVLAKSQLTSKYNEHIDRESAFEILTAKLKKAKLNEQKLTEANQNQVLKSKRVGSQKEELSVVEKMSKNTMVRQAGRIMVREIMRGLLGVLTGKK